MCKLTDGRNCGCYCVGCQAKSGDIFAQTELAEQAKRVMGITACMCPCCAGRGLCPTLQKDKKISDAITFLRIEGYLVSLDKRGI